MADHISFICLCSLRPKHHVHASRVSHRNHKASSSNGSWSPLRGLPPLPKVHHSYRVSNFSAADPLHDDMVRITGACPLSILDDNGWSQDMILECVTAAARHNATLSVNHSPWFVHYNSTDAPGEW